MPAKKLKSTQNMTRFPLVFVHGSFANGNSWRKIINHLTTDNICINLDLPGHGQMDDPTDFSSPTFEPEFDAIRNAI
ncbi:MAG: hypothetical protein HOH19_09495 [Kordiimonadaceae bacterium]|jgi:pimeloyl-ACP methyl ester carboxylesterase|nr:hypothetical protein [Kordiimonadaceae bacterium]MBT6032797.1 hypothetical protein [Kordiimonadaceae bacterium]